MFPEMLRLGGRQPEVKRKFHVVEASLVRKSGQLYSSRCPWLSRLAGDGRVRATLQRLVSAWRVEK